MAKRALFYPSRWRRRIIEGDVRDAAVVIAATLHHLAMRDQMVPRFAPSDMPPPVQRNSSAQ